MHIAKPILSLESMAHIADEPLKLAFDYLIDLYEENNLIPTHLVAVPGVEPKDYEKTLQQWLKALDNYPSSIKTINRLSPTIHLEDRQVTLERAVNLNRSDLIPLLVRFVPPTALKNALLQAIVSNQQAVALMLARETLPSIRLECVMEAKKINVPIHNAFIRGLLEPSGSFSVSTDQETSSSSSQQPATPIHARSHHEDHYYFHIYKEKRNLFSIASNAASDSQLLSNYSNMSSFDDFMGIDDDTSWIPDLPRLALPTQLKSMMGGFEKKNTTSTASTIRSSRYQQPAFWR